MADYMKKPCQHCPFRHDVKPFLRPKRGEELAYATQNPYNTFPCHKTTEYDEDCDDGTMVETERSKACFGFLQLQINEAGVRIPKGFVWSELIYEDPWAMTYAYNNQKS